MKKTRTIYRRIRTNRERTLLENQKSCRQQGSNALVNTNYRAGENYGRLERRKTVNDGVLKRKSGNTERARLIIGSFTIYKEQTGKVMYLFSNYGSKTWHWAKPMVFWCLMEHPEDSERKGFPGNFRRSKSVRYSLTTKQCKEKERRSDRWEWRDKKDVEKREEKGRRERGRRKDRQNPERLFMKVWGWIENDFNPMRKSKVSARVKNTQYVGFYISLSSLLGASENRFYMSDEKFWWCEVVAAWRKFEELCHLWDVHWPFMNNRLTLSFCRAISLWLTGERDHVYSIDDRDLLLVHAPITNYSG